MKTSLITLFPLLSPLLHAAPGFEVWSYTERSLFPSAIISTATVDWNGDEENAEDRKDGQDESDDFPVYGDENGWLAVDLTDIDEGANVEVEISIDGFMKPSRWVGKITRVTEDGEARVFPNAAWNYEALHTVRQQRPAVLSATVKVDGKTLPVQHENCIIRSINDCPFYVLWDEDGTEYEDFSWMFAAYVNENHPLVDEILKEALQSGLVESFSGYQSGDPDQVILQVFAIWNVLQRRGIKYSDISTTTPGKFVISQTVRFIDDSIKSTQANCVDGTVLMASLLRKIGIHPYLVMVPGHCLLAFDMGRGEDDEIVGLETTLLGNDNLKPLSDLPKMPKKAREGEFKKSLQTFTHAMNIGDQTLQKHAADFESGENPNIQMIPVGEARDFGIMPIASGEKAK